ncbi:MAG TPA: TetR/AcrR family transcriptional regulator [Nakamurella sp.]|nr:TetR/AcrR family transcriptional regulator [Nakamurella sp.]
MTQDTADGPPAGPSRRRGGTRQEIVDVAMRLFAERGYDKTSLREIADEVGVTKAALYYHFRTKDDIVRSAMQSYTDGLIELVDRAERRPPGTDRNRELVDGLLELFSTTGGAALRFGQANPTALSQIHLGEIHLTQLKRLIGLLAGDGASAEGTIRAALAFGALVIGVIGGEIELRGSSAERAQAARTVALELLAALDPR